jgi:hypothetical protein
MPELIKPKGVNFLCSKELSAIELSKVLCKTASFIQQIEPYAKLNRYSDWWEHDGLHFYQESINFDRLFSIIHSPKALLESMTGDFNVFIGIAPENNSWYLRFYLEWNEDDENLVGRFDVSFPKELAEKFKEGVLSQFNLEIKVQDAEQYYQSIIL